APEKGIMTSWNLQQTLLHRPVRQGDALFQQIDHRGRWIVELQILEDRSGYVSRRLSDLAKREDMKVDFVLLTEPEKRYSGTIRELSPRTDMTSAGHIVRAIVDLDPTRLPPLRDGAEVKARLDCGRRSVGFVMFREIIEILYTYFWY
ncbi:MAG: HlyD family secretion protein, partial [Planctomycetes bacterium]|nr:HlyD family secretion protein [Planctomycetota bacterium]